MLFGQGQTSRFLVGGSLQETSWETWGSLQVTDGRERCQERLPGALQTWGLLIAKFAKAGEACVTERKGPAEPADTSHQALRWLLREDNTAMGYTSSALAFERASGACRSLNFTGAPGSSFAPLNP